ncbi:hypothetical protein B0J13DRAFT_641803 [Dactylonectria estremocensis]|uniref:Uncharacterized protein n=1 Tax=Dactylonectria estremocensis TaxID=1079267 RepID=A0A9P9IW66_9HYPO|nr:hypothetical protein B0J13DRAFT_641803 [Dactylonectria estremocensis]
MASDSGSEGARSPNLRFQYVFSPMRGPVTEQGERPRPTRRPTSPDWKPPLAVGASLGEGLSRLEGADRLVAQWEAILENSRETQPNTDLSPFERQLDKVRRERDEMEVSDENTAPVEELESTKRERIERRIHVLEEAWRGCGSEVGKLNIRAAIDAYRKGRILCWDKWTLVYAGHIVDFCPTYESFALDRDERLDRYFQEHGEGWLWFEAPLAPREYAEPGHLFGATWAQPSHKKAKILNGVSDAWYITMGFRRVSSFHSRWIRPQDAKRLAKEPSQSKILTYPPAHTGLSKKQLKGRKYAVRDDPDGPRCFFLMHLDSGASFPTLRSSDLAILGIDAQVYPAQTVTSLVTANGTINTPLIEMRVDVCRHDGSSLVGENPVWPQERHELGGILPVSMIPGTDDPIEGESGGLSAELVEEWRQQGKDVSEEALAHRRKKGPEIRLSGMLPFQVCYSACAPGMTPWFGEDRRDVLGADRMPGQCRYEIHKGVLSLKAPVDVEITERPRQLVFEHELGPGRKLRDADVLDRPGASVTTLINGTKIESAFLVEPRGHLESRQD